ncbi:ankyrin repeat-containing domain protein [Baffinella frigidus]|nr:ankyrin repeat-containing domain protein [Cryptophyta sp. CCMP2293]
MWSAKKTPAEVAAEKVNALCEHAYAGSLVATKVAVTAETDANQTATAGICKGLTPLCSAAKGNTDTDEVVKYLLDHRTKIVPAKTGKLVFHTEVNMMADGRAPLHYAAAAGNAKIVKMLLEQNADVDLLATGPATAAHKGKTPLFLAVTNTQINVSKLAIDEREELKKHGNVVKILLAHNADVKSTFDFKIGLEKRKEDWTVLHEAVEKLDHDMVKAILSSVDGKGLLAATAKITGSVQENVFSFRTPYDVALHKATNAKDEKQKQLADKIEQTLKEG